jgi:hypothetical protein
MGGRAKSRHSCAKAICQEFVNKASADIYGGMYHKYLVELYTGILNSPAKSIGYRRKRDR